MQILKRMKNQKAPLLDLLDLILEQGPAPAYGLAVEMGCPRHPGSHLIRFEDFQLLEKIEGALGTAEQTVRSVNFGWMEEPALSARISRQQEKVAVFHAWRIMISSMEGAEAWKTIMEACEEYKPIGCVQVLRGVGEEGWDCHRKKRTGRGLEGQKDHLRDIWDAISEYFLLEGDAIRSLIFDKSDGGAGWRRLEQFVDMSKEEFDAWFGSRFG